jgi:hypothetical protein
MFVHTITTAVSVIASLAKTKSVEKKRKEKEMELFGPNPALAILRSTESGVVGPYLA